MSSPTEYITLKAYNPELLANVISTYLTDRPTAGSSTTLTVQNISGIGDGDYLLIEEFGVEKAEIVRVSGAPSGSTVTLTGAVTFSHEKNVKVYRIDRNQVEFSRSTTLTGSKSVLVTQNIQPDRLWTTYEDTSNTTGFGFYRWKNSADTTYSNYSESFPYAGYAENSLKEIFDSVLFDMGLLDAHGVPRFEGKISRDAMFKAARDCQLNLAGLRDQWSYLTDFDVTVATMTIGQDTYALPDGISRETGQGGVLALRPSKDREMDYLDKREFDLQERLNVVQSTLNTSITSGSTSIILDDSADFADSGAIKIVDDDSAGLDDVDYTANTRSTDTLSGVTNIAENHTAGAIIWQGADFGKPRRFTVFEGNIKINPIPDEDWHGHNLIGDLYKAPTLVNDLADETQFPAFVLKSFIKWKMMLIKYNGDVTKADPDHQVYLQDEARLLRNENTGQRKKPRPARKPAYRTNL